MPVHANAKTAAATRPAMKIDPLLASAAAPVYCAIVGLTGVAPVVEYAPVLVGFAALPLLAGPTMGAEPVDLYGATGPELLALVRLLSAATGVVVLLRGTAGVVVLLTGATGVVVLFMGTAGVVLLLTDTTVVLVELKLEHVGVTGIRGVIAVVVFMPLAGVEVWVVVVTGADEVVEGKAGIVW